MALAMTETYRRKPQVVAREIAGEHLLIPIRGKLADMRQVFTLNPVAGHIWEGLDGTRSLDQVATAVTDAFDVEPEQARRDVADLAAQLLEAGLIETAT